MQTIKFNTPLQDRKYFNNVKRLLDSKKSLHGLEKIFLKSKKS